MEVNPQLQWLRPPSPSDCHGCNFSILSVFCSLFSTCNSACSDSAFTLKSITLSSSKRCASCEHPCKQTTKMQSLRTECMLSRPLSLSLSLARSLAPCKQCTWTLKYITPSSLQASCASFRCEGIGILLAHTENKYHVILFFSALPLT